MPVSLPSGMVWLRTAIWLMRGAYLRMWSGVSNTALLKAVAALKAKADLYVRATGYTLGRLVNLSEGGGYTPGPVRPLPMMAMAKVASTPVEAGELEIRIEVSGVYEMSR